MDGEPVCHANHSHPTERRGSADVQAAGSADRDRRRLQRGVGGYGPNPGLAGAAGEPSNGSGGVVKLDPASGRELSSRFESVVPTALMVAHGSVWVALSNGVNGLDRLDEASDHPVADTPIPVGEQPTGLATGDGAIWVLNYSDGTITRVNPASDRVTGTIAFGPRTDPNRLAANSPIRLAVTPGTLWVSDAAANALHRLSAR